MKSKILFGLSILFGVLFIFAGVTKFLSMEMPDNLSEAAAGCFMPVDSFIDAEYYGRRWIVNLDSVILEIPVLGEN